MNETHRDRIHLSARDIQRARTHRAILRDRLAEERARAADLWLRSLVAETPLADGAYRTADGECRRIEEELRAVEERLAVLEQDHDAGGGVGE